MHPGSGLHPCAHAHTLLRLHEQTRMFSRDML